MRVLTTLITVLLLMQSTVCTEETWRFIALADWHLAEIYAQPSKYPGGRRTTSPASKCSRRITAVNSSCCPVTAMSVTGTARISSRVLSRDLRRQKPSARLANFAIQVWSAHLTKRDIPHS